MASWRDALYGPPLEGEGMADELPPVEAWPADLRLRVGTSGWAYRHWLGRFYPRRTPGREMLAFHSRRFATVEVNSTFYRAPSEKTMDAWREQTPPGYRVSLKMPRTVTHDKRLVSAEPEVREFLALARRLGPKLGIVLVQMPPSFRADHALLDSFLAELPVDLSYAVELRHRSWRETAGATRRVLERHGVARVAHDFGRKATPLAPTAPFTYLRLHGPTGRYRGSYDVETLLAWAQQLAAWIEGGYEAWCYLNNDERGHGPRNAVALRAYAREALGDKTKHGAMHARRAWRDPLAPLRAS